MNPRNFCAPLIAIMVLFVSACTNDSAEELPTTTPTPVTSTNSTTSSTTLSKIAQMTTSESIPTQPVSVPVAELPPSSPPAASATTTHYPSPDNPFGIECFSGTPDQWPANVNPEIGCRPVIAPGGLEGLIEFSIQGEVSQEPDIVECLSGTPGPTLMSDGTVQYTDHCYQQGISHPGYVDEGELVNRFWQCMDEGGETEACRELAHSF